MSLATTASDREPERLEYQARRRRGRRWRRWTLAATLVVAAAMLAWWKRELGRQYWAHGRYLYNQRQCLNYRPPADKVAYEEDPARAASLRVTSAEYRPAMSGNPAWLNNGGASPTGYVPDGLQRLWKNWVCIVMLGEMRTPSGDRRLGLVGFQMGPGRTGGRDLRIYGSGKKLATWEPGSRVEGRAAGALKFELLAQDRLRMYAGRSDESDPSRLVIRYELNGQSGTIDGRLDDEGDIALRVVDGPALSRVADANPSSPYVPIRSPQ